MDWFSAPKNIASQPGPYITPLSPAQKGMFDWWVQRNNVPYDPSPTADYDMPGFFQGFMRGDPNAVSGVNPYDNRLHFTDTYKTPFHQSFSNESQHALPMLSPFWSGGNMFAPPIKLQDRSGFTRFSDTGFE